MVREVVQYGDPVRDAAHLEPSSHAAKGGQAVHDPGRRDPLLARHRDGRKRVAHVVLAAYGHADLGERLLSAQYAEVTTLDFLDEIDGTPTSGLDAVTLHPAPRRCRDLAGHRTVLVAHKQAATGYQVCQTAERGLDLIQIAIDVGVVELHRTQDRRVGPVVHELRPLVEEGRVVLVTLDDERPTPAQPVGMFEVQRQPADEETGILSRACQQPGDHGRGGRLAVGPGDDDGMPVTEKTVGDERGHRNVGQAAVQHLFQLRVAAADRVANHDQIRGPDEMSGIEAAVDLEPHRLQDLRRGWVQRAVRPADPATAGVKQTRQRGHAGATDADHVDVFLCHVAVGRVRRY